MAVTPHTLAALLVKARRGKASKDEARKLLLEFERRAKLLRHSGVSPVDCELVSYVAERIKRHLEGKGELERLLGLRNPQHRPVAMAGRNIEIAAEVLRLRRTGKTLDAACVEAAKRFHKSEDRIRSVYSANKKKAETVLAQTALALTK